MKQSPHRYTPSVGALEVFLSRHVSNIVLNIVNKIISTTNAENISTVIIPH